MYIDTHAHYDDQRFDNDREELLKKVFATGVELIINPASSYESIDMCIKLSEQYEKIFIALGVHPHNACDLDEEKFSILSEKIDYNKVVAIGEIGLDYHYDFSEKKDQQFWFRRQINLAKDKNKPIIVHNRESNEDILRIIKEENARDVGGVFHCFSGSVEMAKEVLEQNFYISIGGPITFKNVRKSIEVVEYVPVEKLLIETDSPYLTPDPYRGKRNDSMMLKYIAEKISEIKGIEIDVLKKILVKNAKTLFGI